MRRTTTAIAAAVTVGAAFVLTIAVVVGIALFGTSDRDRLDQAWSEISSDDRATICSGYLIFPDYTASEMKAQIDMDEDVIEDFLDETCGSAA